MERIERTLSRIQKGCLWLAACALVVIVGRNFLVMRRVHAQISSAAASKSVTTPFTSVLKETDYDQNGTPTPTMLLTWAVRSDGSRVFQVQSIDPHNKIPSGTKQLDFSSGERVRLGMFVPEKSTTRYPDSQAYDWVRSPSSNCLDSLAGKPMTAGQQLDEHHQIVSGVDTVKITLQNVTWWFAPGYGCAPVKEVAKWEGGGRSEQDLVSLAPGEPPAALFDVPRSYKEVSASRLLLDIQGANCNNCAISPEILQRLDNIYQTHHAN